MIREWLPEMPQLGGTRSRRHSPGVRRRQSGRRPWAGRKQTQRTDVMARHSMKPSKAVRKRFKVTKNGKVKRHHGFTSHLMSSRSANRRRKLRRADVVPESHARRMRKLMGISKSPGKIATAKAKARREALAKAAEATPAVAA